MCAVLSSVCATTVGNSGVLPGILNLLGVNDECDGQTNILIANTPLFNDAWSKTKLSNAADVRVCVRVPRLQDTYKRMTPICLNRRRQLAVPRSCNDPCRICPRHSSHTRHNWFGMLDNGQTHTRRHDIQLLLYFLDFICAI